MPSLKIKFTATVNKATLGSDLIIILPDTASLKLPSKGMNSVEGHINGKSFISTLEPDGGGGHILRIDKDFGQDISVSVNDKVDIEFTSVAVEPEPRMPIDLKKALNNDLEAKELWSDITTLARRDWIHWIITAKQSETRKRRIIQTCSKLKDGKRRPCCFNYQCAVVSYEPK